MMGHYHNSLITVNFGTTRYVPHAVEPGESQGHLIALGCSLAG